MSTRDELRQVEEDLARLKAANRELRAQVGEMGATDLVERSSMIQMADEQDVVISDLERRREDLLQRLGG